MVERTTLASIADGLSARGDDVALRWVHESSVQDWSYGRLTQGIDQVAASLLAGSEEKRDAIALLAPNSPAWAAAFFAITGSGRTAVLLDSALDDGQVIELLAAAGCRRCVTTPDRAGRLRSTSDPAGIDFTAIDAASMSRELSSRAGIPPEPPARGGALDPEAVACLLFTSGTTASPKLVPLTHRNLLHNVGALLSENLVGPADSVLLPLPLHHVFPLTVGLLATLAAGGTIIFPEGVSGPQIVEALQRTKPNVMIGVPRLYEALVAGIERRIAARGRLPHAIYRTLLWASDVGRRHTGLRPGRLLFPSLHRFVGSRLRYLVSGGAHLDDEIWSRLENLGWEVLTGYGLTETSPVATFTPHGRARIGTEGFAVPGVELRIDKVEGADVGEILVRGPNVFGGYKDDPDRTRAAFDPDGWFRTGDLGALDGDGYLRVVGRRDDLVVMPDGKNVFPERIERVYGQSPFIREAAVLARRGRLVALVVPDFDALRARGTARLRSVVNEEIEMLGQSLARFERVTGTVIVSDPLPRTRLGKLRRNLLPAILAAASHMAEASEARPAAERPRFATPAETHLWDWLESRFPERTITLGSSLQLDLGVDSLEWVDLTLDINQRFGVRLTEESLSGVVTVRDLIAVIAAAEAAYPSKMKSVGRDRAEGDGLDWLEPRGFGYRSIAWCLYLLNRVAMRLAFRVRADGLENLPLGGPAILAPNHSSFLDPFVLAAVLPWRLLCQTHWAGWTERLLASPVTRFVSRVAQALPVDPDRGPAAGLALAEKALARRRFLVWFPEGRRSPSGELLPLQPGIGVLISRSRAPVLPIQISGTYAALPRGRRWPRPSRVRVRFGQLVDHETLKAGGNGVSTEARITNALHGRMARLADRPGRAPPPGGGNY
jgi:long-chain acyl-CoA synthetase